MANINSNHLSLFLLKFIKNHNIVAHNIDSFNEFLGIEGLKSIICNVFKIQDEIVFNNSVNNTYNGNRVNKMRYVLNFIDTQFNSPTYVNSVTNMTELLTPHIARLKNLTYSSEIKIECDINIEYYMENGSIEKQTINIKNLYIGEYPVMVKSNICNLRNATRDELINVYKEDPNDNGGYFIIGGIEWTIDTSENVLYNSFRSYNNQHNNEKSRGEFISKPGDGFEISREIIMRLNIDDLITIQFVGSRDIHSDCQIPFYLIFRLYGVLSDKKIFEYILLDFDKNDPYYSKLVYFIQVGMSSDRLKSTRFDKLVNVYNHKELLIEFGKAIFVNKKMDDVSIIQSVYSLLDKSLLMHIGDNNNHNTRVKKLIYFGSLIRKLILVNSDIYPVTDRDSYSNKRLHSAGVSYSKSFKSIFRLTVVQGIKTQIKTAYLKSVEKSNVDLHSILNNRSIGYEKLAEDIKKAIKQSSPDIVYSDSTIIKPNRVSSQMLIRKNQLNVISTLRVIHTQNTSSSNQTSRAIDMRSVHPTYVGYICPIATADTGEKVGLSKQLAISAIVTISSNSEVIKHKVSKLIVPLDDIIEKNSLYMLKQHTQVYVNGDLRGCVINTRAFINKMKEMRMQKKIDKYTTIHYKILLDEVYIWVDYGRVTRPLIKVYNNIDECHKPNFEFKQWIKLTIDHVNKLNNDEISIIDLEDEGIFEYISSEEQENCYLAYNIDELYKNSNNILKQYTHIDIEESMLGITALTSPYLNHTMAQRGSYQTNQAKQSCGWFTINPYDRYDKKKVFQPYCEYPLVKTITSNLTYPNGVNLMVAMMCYTGFGQDDSAIINRSVVDNGYMSSYNYSYSIVKITDHSTEFIRLSIPSESVYKSNSNYDYLDDKGIIIKGSVIANNTVLVSKLVSGNKKDDKKFIDKSEIYYGNELVIVDGIETSYYNPHCNIIESVKIRLKSYRKLFEGDKLSTRSGNKNIISSILNPADMPYTLSGEVPDLIVNPQGIPTRMCVGQLLESIFSKLAINKGQFIDGTAFSKFNIDAINSELNSIGIDKGGVEKMICGKTGHIIDAFIFYTPLYIQHIMKFALEEMYVINHNGGPVDEVTHQPREGKSNNGGLKIGEMEKDVIASHGSINVLQEKFINSSDFTHLYFCKKCGSKAVSNPEEGLYICKICDYAGEVAKVNSTYVTDVLYEYMMMLGVDTRYMI